MEEVLYFRMLNAKKITPSLIIIFVLSVITRYFSFLSPITNEIQAARLCQAYDRLDKES